MSLDYTSTNNNLFFAGNTRSSPSTTLKGMKDPVKSKEADTKSDSGSDYGEFDFLYKKY